MLSDEDSLDNVALEKPALADSVAHMGFARRANDGNT